MFQLLPGKKCARRLRTNHDVFWHINERNLKIHRRPTLAPTLSGDRSGRYVQRSMFSHSVSAAQRGNGFAT